MSDPTPEELMAHVRKYIQPVYAPEVFTCMGESEKFNYIIKSSYPMSTCCVCGSSLYRDEESDDPSWVTFSAKRHPNFDRSVIYKVCRDLDSCAFKQAIK